MKEKSVIIVLDEDKFENQKHLFYEARKTLIHIHDGDSIKKIKKYEKALKDIVKWNQPVIQDYEAYSIAKQALE